MFDHLVATIHGAKAATPSMMCLWAVDEVNVPRIEFKGQVKKYTKSEDEEGVAVGAYAMFFEDKFLALLRPTNTSPGPTKVAEYINHFTDANLAFASLVSPDVLKRLQRPGEDVNKTRLRIRTANLSAIGEQRPDVEKLLRGMIGPTESSEIAIEWKAIYKPEKAGWWSNTRSFLLDLVSSGLIEYFETAKVDMKGNEKPISLLQEYLTEATAVDMLPGEKDVSEEAAAEALFYAYKKRREDLITAYGLQFGN